MINFSFNQLSIIQRSLYSSNKDLATAMSRLASGCRINGASDDAANLSLSNKLSKSMSGLDMAYKNTQNGLGFLNIADSATNSMIQNIQKIRNLAVQAANGIYSDNERSMLNAEAQQRIIDTKQTIFSTKFGDKNVFSPNGISRLTEAEATAKGYIVIKTAADFINKIPQTGASTAGKTYILMGDIDLSSVSAYVPKTNFAGILDGNGYTLSNLQIGNTTLDSQALFATSNGATFQNITLSNFNVQGKANGVATLVAAMTNSSVYNCEAKNVTVQSTVEKAGGLIGITIGAYNIKGCKSSGSVQGVSAVGGLIGALGFAGISSSGTVSGCSSSATVSATSYAGGLVGGAIGTNAPLSTHLIEKSSYSGNVSTTGSHGAAGLVGKVQSGKLIVKNCYTTGTVSGSGGGNAAGLVMDDSNTMGDIINSYSTCKITTLGGTRSGGVVGKVFVGSTVPNLSGVFWDTQLSTTVNGVAGTNMPGATGLTTAQMQNQQNFISAGYDPSVWDLTTQGPPKLISSTSTIQDNFALQVDQNTSSSSQLLIDTSLSLDFSKIDISTISGAQTTIAQCDSLISTLTDKRTYFGATLNALGTILDTNRTRNINMESSKSILSDADMARESARLAKAQILQQFGNTLMKNYKSNYSNLLLTLLK